jgi:dsDNA-binding SOS-regulon protein
MFTKKVKIKFVSSKNKKICTIKITKKEFDNYEKIAYYSGQTLEQFVNKAIINYLNKLQKGSKK